MSTTTFSRETPAGIMVVSERKYGVFRVREGPGSIAEVCSRFKPIAENLDRWALSNKVEALRQSPELSEFRRRFAKTNVRFELLGSVVKGELQEVAVVLVTEAGSGLGVARWVKGQGSFFFQNLLVGKPEPVEAVLAQIEAKVRPA